MITFSVIINNSRSQSNYDEKNVLDDTVWRKMLIKRQINDYRSGVLDYEADEVNGEGWGFDDNHRDEEMKGRNNKKIIKQPDKLRIYSSAIKMWLGANVFKKREFTIEMIAGAFETAESRPDTPIQLFPHKMFYSSFWF